MFSFNPHTHAGCDQIQRDWQEKMWGFNPHTHAGCDCITLSRSYRIAHGFNPHTHAGCDSTKAPPKPSIKVSIHTPTQGVTMAQARASMINAVSIHTPTQGVTFPIDTELILYLFCFNPHTHAGCDNFQVHAVQNLDSFNPHTHAGCDHQNKVNLRMMRVSIHTPTQGVTALIIEARA